MAGEALSPYVREKTEQYGLTYTHLPRSEHDASILRCVRVLMEEGLDRAGEHALEKWEKGWAENLEMLSNNPDPSSVVPLYFAKNHIVRLRQRFVRPTSADFEYHIYGLILDWLFDAYAREADHIYEFGCGPGYNLLRLRRVNSHARLWGLDWASSSQKIVEKMAVAFNDPALFARRFDYFHPDYTFNLEKGAVVCTCASLEQVGRNFEPFVEYLLRNRPALCIHVEPIGELLDEENLLDYLSLRYFQKRKLPGRVSRLS